MSSSVTSWFSLLACIFSIKSSSLELLPLNNISQINHSHFHQSKWFQFNLLKFKNQTQYNVLITVFYLNLSTVTKTKIVLNPYNTRAYHQVSHRLLTVEIVRFPLGVYSPLCSALFSHWRRSPWGRALLTRSLAAGPSDRYCLRCN